MGRLGIQSLPGLIPRRLRRKVKSGFQDTSPLAARSFITNRMVKQYIRNTYYPVKLIERAKIEVESFAD